MAQSDILYDKIGDGYDTTRRADPLIAERLRSLLDVREGGTYLDIGCGTGNYTTALSVAGGLWHGVDASVNMIRAARAKSESVHWHVADVTELPPSIPACDGVSCVLAIHHFPDISGAIREVRRVLRPGGRFVVFTAGREQMRAYWLNAYFPVAMGRAITQMPEVTEVERALRENHLTPALREPYRVQPDLRDSFLYSGKQHPERYLNPRFRAGISTFAALADRDEIEGGCRRLADDLTSGRFREVANQYNADLGDYLFLVAEHRAIPE